MVDHTLYGLPTFSEVEFTEVNSEMLEAASASSTNDGRFIDNISRMQGDITLLKKEVSRLRQDFNQHRKEFFEFKTFMMESVEKILQISCKVFPHYEASQSLLEGCQPDIVEEPFVTIQNTTGEEEKIYLPKHVINDLGASQKERELVRRTLLFLHNNDIAELRQFSLTGTRKATRKPDAEDDIHSQDLQDDSPFNKRQLPQREYMIVLAIVERIFPVPKKLKTDDPALYQKLSVRKVKEVREHITSVLNYFSTCFDGFGSKVRKEKNATPSQTTATPTTANPNKRGRRLELSDPSSPGEKELQSSSIIQLQISSSQMNSAYSSSDHQTNICGAYVSPFLNPQTVSNTVDPEEFLSDPKLVVVRSSSQ